MEVKIITADELRSYDADRRKDLVAEIKHELVTSRMDVYTQSTKNASKSKILRRNLARLLTVGQEEKLASAKKN